MASYSISKQPIIRLSKSNLYGLLGTIMSCGLLFLVLWFYVMPYTSIPQPIEEEGLMISFGDSEDGGGSGSGDLASSEKEAMAASTTTSEAEVKAAPVKATATPQTVVKVAPVKASSAPAQEQLVTQNNSEHEITAVKPTQKTQKDQKAEDAKNQYLEDLKKQQLAEKQENERRQAQKKLEEQKASNKANSLVNGLFSGNATTPGGTSSTPGNGINSSQGGGGVNGTQGSGGGSSKGVGNGQGAGVKGNPAGHGNFGGNSWSLNGRSLVGSLIPPSYNNDVEGKVTVNIRVDETGKVVSASIGSPTTISDSETRNAALYAARSTHFSNGTGTANGTITYNFRLR